MQIQAQRAFYIRFGRGNEWVQECIDKGILLLDYRELPHELCNASGNWDDRINAVAIDVGLGKEPGARTRHLNQVRYFYQSGPDPIWITFHA